MKAPEWVIEMMKTGDPVKCMTEDGKRLIIGFDIVDKKPYHDDHGWYYNNATPIKPPTIRPFRTVEEVEPFFGKVIRMKGLSAVINGVKINNDSIGIFIGSTFAEPNDLLYGATFQDGSPVGITE